MKRQVIAQLLTWHSKKETHTIAQEANCWWIVVVVEGCCCTSCYFCHQSCTKRNRINSIKPTNFYVPLDELQWQLPQYAMVWNGMEWQLPCVMEMDASDVFTLSYERRRLPRWHTSFSCTSCWHFQWIEVEIWLSCCGGLRSWIYVDYYVRYIFYTNSTSTNVRGE